MNSNERLILTDGVEKAGEKKFRSRMGGLIHLGHIRPDIIFTVGIVFRFMHSPSKHHLGAEKRILRYIQGTLNYGIRYTSFLLLTVIWTMV